MSSNDYLEALGAALSKTVPVRERMEILRYYKEYFEDAGPEREQEVIEELGDPQALAERIAREGGYTGAGYDGAESAGGSGRAGGGASGSRPKRRVWPYVAIGVVALVMILSVSAVTRLLWGTLWSRVGGSEAVSTPVMHDPVSTPEPTGVLGAAADGTMEAVTEFTNISVDVSLGDVKVQTGGEFGVALDDFDNEMYRMEYSVQNGKLRVWSARGSFSVNGLTNIAGGVTITVPAGLMLGDVEIHTGMGDVTLVNVSAMDIETETGMGDVSAYELGQAQELSMNTGMGDIELDGALPLSSELETGMGDITVNAACPENQCRYELESGLGEVKVDGRARGKEVENEASGAVYELDAGTGLGDVRVNFQ